MTLTYCYHHCLILHFLSTLIPETIFSPINCINTYLNGGILYKTLFKLHNSSSNNSSSNNSLNITNNHNISIHNDKPSIIPKISITISKFSITISKLNKIISKFNILINKLSKTKQLNINNNMQN